MVTRLRAILSTLRPSCLHNQPYRCGTWSRAAAVRLSESKLATILIHPLLLCSRFRPPPRFFLKTAGMKRERELVSEIFSRLFSFFLFPILSTR